MIVVDTLSASGILDDENDNAKAATVMKAFAELSIALNCLVLVMHHPPKSGHGERGAGAIRNNADYVLEISRDGMSAVRTLEITKSRDADQRTLGSFTLIPKVIGTDEDGDTIETMVVSTGTGVGVDDGGRRPKHADKFLEALDNVIAVPNGSEVRDGAVEKYDLRKEFRQSAGFPAGSSYNGNVKKAFDATIAYFLRTQEIECVVFDAVEFIRRRKIEI